MCEEEVIRDFGFRSVERLGKDLRGGKENLKKELFKQSVHLLLSATGKKTMWVIYLSSKTLPMYSEKNRCTECNGTMA